MDPVGGPVGDPVGVRGGPGVRAAPGPVRRTPDARTPPAAVRWTGSGGLLAGATGVTGVTGVTGAAPATEAGSGRWPGGSGRGRRRGGCYAAVVPLSCSRSTCSFHSRFTARQASSFWPRRQ
ncbi:hypothetical protein GCM10010342_35550 [Streptomyces anulatus]|nr:hypothetical protein GCM10010342_35550 [Streptomyces anulatus]